MKRITFFILALALQLSYSVMAQGIIGTDQSFAKTNFCKKYGCYLVEKGSTNELTSVEKTYTYEFKNKKFARVTNTWNNGEILYKTQVYSNFGFSFQQYDQFILEYLDLFTGIWPDGDTIHMCVLNALHERQKEGKAYRFSFQTYLGKKVSVSCEPSIFFNIILKTYN